MEKIEEKKRRFGLVGKDISYSFSRGYFSNKFAALKASNSTYENFDLAQISLFESLIKENTDLTGLNVTIPYKELIIPYMDSLDETAREIGAVNTIEFTNKGLKGHNTDAYGFHEALTTKLKKQHQNALILGTGGASKAIAYVFKKLNIAFRFVSRNPENKAFSYEELDKNLIQKHQIIVNCSPVGTHPNILDRPNIPYQHINRDHLLFDLIYNPKKTAFLKEGEKNGALIENGLAMLKFQAEKAWEIWNS